MEARQAGLLRKELQARRGRYPHPRGTPEAAAGATSDSHAIQDVIDTSSDWLKSYYKARVTDHALPLIDQLESVVEEPLPTKISIHPLALAEIRGAFGGTDPQDVLDKLFVEDSTRFCKALKKKVVDFVTNLEAGDGTGTEASFIYLWDIFIRIPLATVFPMGTVNRDTNASTSTGSGRPDFVFTLNSVCVFRGEEEAPGVDISIPRDELYSKLTWTYGDAPYIFAYAASGFKCRLFALRRVGETSKSASVEIGEFRLHFVVDRLRLLLALLQIGRLFHAITIRCPASSQGEYVNIPRNSGEVVHLDPWGARKDFSAATNPQGAPVDFNQVADHVHRVYRVLELSQVPNVDSLVRVKRSKHMICLKPRGYLRNPTSLTELFCALRHVLEALVALHRASWMHRDIRWPNVLKQQEEDGGGWFLIDFMDAALSPQPNSPAIRLAGKSHAPEIFLDGGNHTTAVDLWSVGHLIDECSVNWDDAGPRTALLERLLARDPRNRPTAEDALREVCRLESEHTDESSTRRGDAKVPRAKRAKLSA